ncbi:Heterogeneous nuclear ribonucleoprotein K, partial [Galemys pyrenaicus]
RYRNTDETVELKILFPYKNTGTVIGKGNKDRKISLYTNCNSSSIPDNNSSMQILSIGTDTETIEHILEKKKKKEIIPTLIHGTHQNGIAYELHGAFRYHYSYAWDSDSYGNLGACITITQVPFPKSWSFLLLVIVNRLNKCIMSYKL